MLRVDAALLDGEGDAVDGEHVGGDAVVDVVGLGVADHVVEAVAQDGFELLVDDGFFPEVALAVLHPLEVAGGDAAGVGQDVGHDEDALFGEDLVGDGGGGAVGAFDDDARLDLAALRLVMTFSVAAGMRISHSETSSSSLGMASAPRKPRVVPLRYLYSTSWWMSMPAGL